MENRNTSILLEFEKMVLDIPNHVAVVFKTHSLTYLELNSRANQVAWQLRKMGVSSNSIVGLKVERSLERIIGLFGILKAGGAYLPLSESDPKNRIEELLADSAVHFIVTLKKNSKGYKFPFGKLILLEDIDTKLPTHNCPIPIKKTHLAYVIYTSGSTGKPKAVMIEHGALMNRLEWMQRKYPLGIGDTLLQKTPYTFDVSVWELLWWSFTGSKLCLLPPGMESLPMALLQEVQIHKITVIHFVPSMLGVFLHYTKETQQDQCLKSLKTLFCSGEVLKKVHVKCFKDILADKYNTKITNLYGPTEATIDVTYFDLDLKNIGDQIPIGKPIDGIKFYIVENDKEVENGKVGELWLQGIGVARGYLNRVELTARKFKSNLFSVDEKVYKTGDLVKLLPDGNIAYLGRMDDQVKIHGVRIELGEIESVLTSYPRITEGTVILKQYSENIKVLAAYFVAEEIDIKQLKLYLSSKLPRNMIPKEFIALKELPLNKNGKLDRKVLSSYDSIRL